MGNRTTLRSPRPLTRVSVFGLVRSPQTEPTSPCDCFGLTGTGFHDYACPNHPDGKCTYTLQEVFEMGWIPPGLAVDPRCYICGDPILQGKEFWTLDGNWWCHLHQPVWSRQ